MLKRLSPATLRRVLPLLVIGLAACLRLYNLPWKSVDNDEAYSWATAHKPFGQILYDSITIRGDPHPPVYWVSLRAWILLGGDSEVSMRLFTALTGLTAVALVGYLGRRLFSPAAGTAAALFAALSPGLIWNSQDARMYTLAGTLALAGLVFLVEGLQRGGWGRWLGYFTFTALAGYTHIGGAFLWPVEGVVILISALWFRRTWWRAAVTLGVVGLVYIPYAFNAWHASSFGNAFLRQALPYPELLHEVTAMLVYTTTGHLSNQLQWAILGLTAALFGLGVLLGREARALPRGLGRTMAALFYLAVLLVIVLLSLREPVFHPKMITLVGGALALGLGAGWQRLWQWQRAVGALAGLCLIGAEVYGISTLWQNENLKEDWRHAAHLVSAEAGPNDQTLVYFYYYRDAFNYYSKGAMPVVGLSSLPAEADAALPQYTAGHDVLWLVQSGEYLIDPDHVMQKWFEARYPEVTEVYPSGIIVKGFAINYRTAALPALATPAQVTYPNGLTLAGYRIPETTLPVNDQYYHPPSTWVHTTLYWSVAQPLAQNIRVAVALEDEAGNAWGGDLPRANDLSAFYPPLKWQPGEVVRQDFDINTNPILTAGSYKVVLRVFAAGSDAALVNSTGEDWLILDRVNLTR